MINVTFEKEKSGTIRKVIVEGHAFYDEPGADIVCSAVSILTITIMNGLEKVVGIDPKDFHQEVDAGYTSFDIPYGLDSEKDNKVDTLLKVYELGIVSTSEAYSDYISVKQVYVEEN